MVIVIVIIILVILIIIIIEQAQGSLGSEKGSELASSAWQKLPVLTTVQLQFVVLSAIHQALLLS